jgi:quercetin dioxygenase-like cupin family protein
MNGEMPSASSALSAGRIASGDDRHGEQRKLGISNIAFKVSAQDSRDVFILENTLQGKGGPERHLHYEQDEWFYVVEGEFRFEVGDTQHTLVAGDSLMAARGVPHVWASIGESGGRILIVFTPAGKMEAFFRHMALAGRMPGPDPELWRTYGMEWLGPPLLTR